MELLYRVDQNVQIIDQFLASLLAPLAVPPLKSSLDSALFLNFSEPIRFHAFQLSQISPTAGGFVDFCHRFSECCDLWAFCT